MLGQRLARDRHPAARLRSTAARRRQGVRAALCRVGSPRAAKTAAGSALGMGSDIFRLDIPALGVRPKRLVRGALRQRVEPDFDDLAAACPSPSGRAGIRPRCAAPSPDRRGHCRSPGVHSKRQPMRRFDRDHPRQPGIALEARYVILPVDFSPATNGWSSATLNQLAEFAVIGHRAATPCRSARGSRRFSFDCDRS